LRGCKHFQNFLHPSFEIDPDTSSITPAPPAGSPPEEVDMKHPFKKTATALVALVALAAVGFAPTAASAKAKKPKADIVDTAVGAGSFKTLAAALGAAGLVDTLKGPGPFTVFAPTDEAFAKLPADTVAALLKPENKAALTSVLTYHVVAGKVLAKQVVKLNGKSVPTVNGASVDVTVAGGKVKVNESNVVKTDILATNGVIHVIDAVLIPKDLKLAAAPAATTVPPTTKPAATKDIVDTAVANGSFKTLAAALGAAGLVDTLKGAGPFTVFAPTDAAFAKLPAGTVEALIKPENKAALTSILTYHVVSGKVPASTVVTLNGKTAKTVNGADVNIKVVGTDVFVNDAKVVITDVMATNGIIHVIDTVLIPPAAGAAPAAPPAGNSYAVAKTVPSLSTLVAAVDAAGLAATLQGPGPFTIFAPDNIAFKVAGDDTVANLLKPENKATLTSILTYHVVPGTYTAADILKAPGHKLKTVNGKELRFAVSNGKLLVNGAGILTADVKTGNGVVHIIDTVLIP
jgi:transforming growth factor-beta-induced protein